MNTKTWTCPHCGESNSPKYSYCGGCGTLRDSTQKPNTDHNDHRHNDHMKERKEREAA